jgi:BCD family chlorophyll transporter-like MFS transporter
MIDRPLGWRGIARLGLVQAALGAVVVLTTSTLNRVMVVELNLPALLPGLLVALHYLVQVVRPRFGHGSDLGGRRTPWIIGGMAVLALGGVVAALATACMGPHLVSGIALAILGFVMIGLGVGAAGTSLLVLLAKRVDARRRAAAATIVWMMMIVGFIVTAGLAGHFLDPFSPVRLVKVASAVSAIAFLLTWIGLHDMEGPTQPDAPLAAPLRDPPRPAFRSALVEVWADPQARRFTVFVFISMLAYSAQDLILEPFAGVIFGFTPGASTQLSSVQHGGVLLGMILVAVAGSAGAAGGLGSLRGWMMGGCIASAAAVSGLALAGLVGPAWPLRANVFVLGAANGAFSIAAIGCMMSLAGAGRESREGIRMGLWGAAQAVAFGLGGLVGTAANDLSRYFFGATGIAYAAVFAAEAAVFLCAARLASEVAARRPRDGAAILFS